MRNEVFGALLAVLIVTSLGAGYLVGAGNRQTSTLSFVSTITSFGTSTLRSILTSTSTLSQTVYSTTTKTVSTATSIVISAAPIPVSSIETADVPVGGSPFAIGVNPNTNRVYIPGASNALIVIDAVSHSVVAKVTLPNMSNDGIAIDTKSNTVYVLVQGGIVVINGTTNTIIKEFPIDFAYRSIAFDSSTHTLYGLAAKGTGNLLGVDGRTGAVVANVSLGYGGGDIVVNPRINMIYAVGCDQYGLVCDSKVSIVNGTSKTVVSQVHLGSDYYASVTIDQGAGFVYVTGNSRLVELDPFGTMIYNSYPETCGPFISMSVDSSLNQVILAPQNFPYLLAYNRFYGNLVNMYSLPNVPQVVTFNSGTNETYVIVADHFLAFHSLASTGHVNSTLIGSDQNCLPV